MAKLSAKNTFVVVGKYILSTRAKSFDAEALFDELDVPAFTEGSHNSIKGLSGGGVSLAGYFDPATTGDVQSHKAFSALTAETALAVSLGIGQGSAVAVGDPAYSFWCQQFVYRTDPSVTEPILYEAEMKPKAYKPDWGVMLTAGEASSASGATHTGAAVDYGAQTTNGGVGYLHVTQAVTTNTYTFLVQDSADDTTYATLISFTLNGKSATSERVSVTNTVDRYTRLLATATDTAGETVKFVSSFARYFLGQEAPA